MGKKAVKREDVCVLLPVQRRKGPPILYVQVTSLKSPDHVLVAKCRRKCPVKTARERDQRAFL